MKIKTILGSIAFMALVHGQTSAQSLEEMAVPVSNPVNFEDPRIESDIRPVFVHHEIDDKFVTGGGSATVYALQARYALTDRLAIIATKDGYVHFQPDSVLDDGTGWANVAAGAKYAFYIDKEAATIATGGLRFEAPIGSHDVLQGRGDGVINPFISAATAIGKLNIIGYTGFRLPIDDTDTSFYDASIHFDTSVCGWFSPLAEVNLYHSLDGGDRLPISDEGQDFFNLGSTASTGESVISGAVGARVPLTKNVSWGAAYEFPMNRGDGSRILDWRVTSDMRIRF